MEAFIAKAPIRKFQFHQQSGAGPCVDGETDAGAFRLRDRETFSGARLRNKTKARGARFYRAGHVKNVHHVEKTTVISGPVRSGRRSGSGKPYFRPDTAASFRDQATQRCFTGDSPLASFSLFPVLCLFIAFLGCSSDSPTPAPKQQPDSPKTGNPKISAQKPEETVQTLADFSETAASAGIHFTYRNGEESGHFAILESLGGGVGMFDYDSDGDVDLFVPGGGRYESEKKTVGLSPGLFRNHGDWRFSAEADVAGVATAPWYSHGAAITDFDNDGFSDVLVTGYGGLLFYQNQGDGTFLEIARATGLTDDQWSSSAACGDIDGDGNPDFYVAHYVNWSPDNNPVCAGPKPGLREVCPPRRFDPLPDIIYHNNGDCTFSDVSIEMQLRRDGKGLGVVMADVDLDGRIDIYVANDTVPNFLYRNSGDGTLEDASTRSGTSLSDSGMPEGSMGVDVGDYNLDGRPDIWVSNFERESIALYRNDDNLIFQHVSRSTGITAVGGLAVGWGTVFFDFDRDGDEDSFVSNGHVIRYPTNAPLRQTPLLFQNDPGSRFHNVAQGAGEYLRTPHMGRGVACGDLDDDGDQDLVISCNNEPVAVLANQSGANHGFVIRLIGTRSNRDAVGAWVKVRVGPDQPEMLRMVKAGGSYASSNDPRLFFGVGHATSVASVEVHWPSGVIQNFSDVAILETLVLLEPNADF